MLTLKQYAASIGGISQLAKLLKCSRQNAHHWVHGVSAPTPKMAIRIIMISHGALDFNSIYTPFVNKKYKGRTFKVGTLTGKDIEFKF